MTDALMPTYGERDLAFDRGEGVYLYTTDGRRLLDFGAGIAVAGLGHCHPHLVESLRAQAGKLWHSSNLYNIPNQQRAADRLVANTFADKVFFTNSGAEAVECGLKLVRKYQYENGKPERYRVITIEGAFHGRTLATIAAGGGEKLLHGFGPAMQGFDQVPFANLNALKAAITEETAAILVEPVQGEGGIRPFDADYLHALREVADEFNLLLFFDEIQCGMGRTGRLFAHEWADVRPDVMAVAKALGGGFPVGACLATDAAAVGMTLGTHGSTYGGNPLATAVVNAVLDVMLADGFFGRVQASARKLTDRLDKVVAAYPTVVEECRGAGLMLGLKCVVPNGEFVKRLANKGLLTIPAADNVVRFLPPLIIEEGHITEAIGIVEATCRELAEVK